jgi:hypothetical protein
MSESVQSLKQGSQLLPSPPVHDKAMTKLHHFASEDSASFSSAAVSFCVLLRAILMV